VDVFVFVRGWRGRAELVRTGAAQGEVTAVFDLDPDHPAQTVLQEAGYPTTEELFLRRINMPDGRKTAWINDRRASGDLLRQLSETLVELHGQHDDRGLLSAGGHRQLLDDFADLSRDLKVSRGAWRNLQRAHAALQSEQVKLAAMREEEDFLRHAVAEFDELEPQSGEEATLDARRRLMQASERIAEDIGKAANAVGGQGAEAMITDATRWLDAVADSAEGQLDEPLNALMQAMNELGRAQQGIEACLNALTFNPTELEQAEERLFAIRALARKHDKQPDDLANFASELRARLATIEGGEADLKRLNDALADAQAAFDSAADTLTKKRTRAAKKLDKAMKAELAPLKMENAGFTTEITTADPGPQGRDAVAFTVSTNPGAPAGPINKIASGGELSRFLLALKVCLTKDAANMTMIFDEIDRGVGGATADAVGRRLSNLADGAQVLVVTHSPQVAARGQHHWQVAKSVSKGITTSKVALLNDDERLDEVARMLAGDTITPEARAAAVALLQS
jgi:DNA repair protein RecN (Recombination protein N)